jgi:hypothetical protein
MADTTVSGIERDALFRIFLEFKDGNPDSKEGFTEYSNRLYWFRGGKYYLKSDPDKKGADSLIGSFVGEGSTCM